MSDRQSPKGSSGESAGSFSKGIQKLIDSDDDGQATLQELQKMFPILKKLNLFMNNLEKITLFLRDHNFRNRLNDKLKDQGILNFHPIVKVQLYSIRYRSFSPDQFHHPDIYQAFSKFGNIVNFFCHTKYAYVEYSDYPSAYIAIKTLNDFTIEKDVMKMSVKWCEGQQEVQLVQSLFLSSKIQEVQLDHTVRFNPVKYMCKYSIYLDECPQFKVAQKIIGPQGSYMKRILESLNFQGADSSKSKNVKLRVRGRGSGYKEGPKGIQSQQRLHLCVSAKDEQAYKAACVQSEQLLLKVTKDYKAFYQKTHKNLPQGIAYRKLQIQKDVQKQVKVAMLDEVQNVFDLAILASGSKITETEILKIISMRETARKMGNFRQADQLRQVLKKRGVFLIDEKGTKGKKTKWKYADE